VSNLRKGEKQEEKKRVGPREKGVHWGTEQIGGGAHMGGVRQGKENASSNQGMGNRSQKEAKKKKFGAEKRKRRGHGDSQKN